ncbi:unnamed protein product [Gadus morhua 'NCC']
MARWLYVHKPTRKRFCIPQSSNGLHTLYKEGPPGLNRGMDQLAASCVGGCVAPQEAPENALCCPDEQPFMDIASYRSALPCMCIYSGNLSQHKTCSYLSYRTCMQQDVAWAFNLTESVLWRCLPD